MNKPTDQPDTQVPSDATPAAKNPPPTERFSKAWFWAPLILVGVIMMSKLPGTSVSFGELSQAVGKPAPIIDLVPLTDSVSLSSLDQVPLGKVILLHFWGTWCGPCKMEYPELAAMVRRWETSNGFQFISVSCESGGSETFDQLKRNTIDYFESSQVDSVAYCDPRTTTRRSVADRLERDSMFFPTTILIGQDGSIVGAWEGYGEGSVAQMHQAIKYLLRR